MPERTIGILGGMGPAATLDLFRRIVRNTPAQCDQDHLHILVDNDPKVPDRTAAIQGLGPDPLPFLTSSAKRLQQAGASFLIMPCNTAHHWLSELRKQVQIPIVDMVRETVAVIARHRPALEAIGVLATSGTLCAALYQNALSEEGIAALTPGDEDQVRVMEAIYQVKAGNQAVEELVLPPIQRLIGQGASGLILGCTELSLLDVERTVSCPVFDPLSILARRATKLATGMEQALDGEKVLDEAGKPEGSKSCLSDLKSSDLGNESSLEMLAKSPREGTTNLDPIWIKVNLEVRDSFPSRKAGGPYDL